jgi:hypothetical protein
MKWNVVDNRRFLDNAKCVIVIWTHDFSLTDIQTRECQVSSKEDWQDFSKNCLLPWYKDGRNYSDPKSVNYSLREYATKYPCTLDPTREMLILTAFHTSVGLRLIADGCHRAVALQTAVNKGDSIPTVTVLECFGTDVEKVFSSDFNRIVLNIRETS